MHLLKKKEQKKKKNNAQLRIEVQWCLQLNIKFFKHFKVSQRHTVIILSFRTKRSCSYRSSLIRVYSVCHSVCLFWMHYHMVKKHCSNFRVITANFQVTEFLGFYSTYNKQPRQGAGHPDTEAAQHSSMIPVYRTTSRLLHPTGTECPLGPSQSEFFQNKATV